MSISIPDKVSAGQTLSASWLNSVVDAIKELDAAQTRRRLLKGNGYLVRESPGGTSLTILQQPRVVGADDGLNIVEVHDFALRIKPKGLCTVDEDGNWDKIVQVRSGKVIDHSSDDDPVEINSLSDDDETDSSSSDDDGDDEGDEDEASDWVDVGKLSVPDNSDADSSSSSSEDDDESESIYVWAVLTLDGDSVSSGAFAVTEGDDEEPELEDGQRLVPIGKVYAEASEEDGSAPVFVIEQYQEGPIEFGGGASMPFDVTLKSETNADTGKKTWTYNVVGGRVFLPEFAQCKIPDKEDAALNTAWEGKTRLLTLTLTRTSDGAVTYKYSLESDSTFGSVLTTSEES